MKAWLLLVACAGCRAHFDAQRFDAPPADAQDAAGGDACMPIAGLLAYYPMEPGDIAGSVLHDRSGNSRDGSIVGSPPPVLGTGKLGSGLDFTATTTAYVDVGGLPLPTSGATVTIVGWFFHGSPAPSEVLFDFPPPPSPRYDVWDTGGSLCINTENGECWGQSGAFLDRWVHLAAILRDGVESTSELYVDGSALVMTCGSGVCTTARVIANPLRLGAADSYAYHGVLDDIRIYDHALAPSEIAALYAGRTCP